MKGQIRKWILRIAATGILLLGLLLGIVLNPTILYAKKTVIGNCIVFHNSSIDNNFFTCLNNASELIRASELYDANFKIDICLNDGSSYPGLMEVLRGPAFGWGFSDKVVLMGDADYYNNTVALNGYKWNLTQLLVHEQIHCLQYNAFGLWHSNPVADYPSWKWEGYPEYVARKKEGQLILAENIARKIELEKMDKDAWAIDFKDSTIAPEEYYNYWLLIQFCIDVKKMSYADILKDTTSEQSTYKQMMEWYEMQVAL